MQLRELNAYQCVGFALELLALSPYHRKFIATQYFWIEINPSLSLRQVKFYVTESGIPCAMVTWAWLSTEVENDLHKTGRALKPNEWNSGNILFFNDFIAPYGNVREISRDLRRNVFPGHVASSLRRGQERNVIKINRWTGVDYQKSHAITKKADTGAT